MSRFTSLDSPDKNLKEDMGYSNDFQAMLEGLEDEDSMEVINCSGKKRRLNIDQVQALERIFEVDNKLDPERKVKLAQELGLQPRQVAIWFQNRRARWKTKQLERDYHLLKANYDALQLSYTKVEQEKENLVAELRGLKEKFGEESHPNQETKDSIGTSLQSSPNNNVSDHHHHHHQKYNDSSELGLMYKNHHQEGKGMLEFKEGFSDSDSSGVLNNEDGNNPMISKLISSSSYNPTFLDQSAAFSLSAAPVYHPHLLDSKDNYHQQQSLNQFTVDESCNFFSQLDQAPPFWYISDPRNQ